MEQFEIQHHPEFDIYYAGHGDPYVWTEQRRDYSRVTERANDQLCIEFGAHCGFHNLWLTRNTNPKHIISLEPDPRLEPIIRKNMRPDTELIMKAVTNLEPDEVPLYLGKTFTATNSLEPYRGRREVMVPTIEWWDLLEREPGYLKCDCEGGEYGLDWSDLPDSLRTVCIEFHFNRDYWHDAMHEIDETLLEQGFNHVKRPKVNTFRKIDIGLYVRD